MTGPTSDTATEERIMPGRCTRCEGRMLIDRVEGDAACFNCGYVVYRIPPPDDREPVRREPRRVYHGGRDIS